MKRADVHQHIVGRHSTRLVDLRGTASPTGREALVVHGVVGRALFRVAQVTFSPQVLGDEGCRLGVPCVLFFKNRKSVENKG